ncbi:MAG TPA: HAMP domain-containing sensor histidine kinase [Puia sp.]|nr:HAMP domain-containing sensor histidine kinase [Puia sp.]
MKHSIVTYIIISIIAFAILSTVQFYLVYNTYELKNQRYFYAEKHAFQEAYTRSIINDKVYPGGQKIIDSFVNGNLSRLEMLYKENRPAFDRLKRLVADSVFSALRRKEALGKFLYQVKKNKNIGDSLEYALVIKSLSILLENGNYIPIYNEEQYRFTDPSLRTKEGIRIGGTLKNLNDQNRVSAIGVSSPRTHSYQILFSLYIDPTTRSKAIMNQMGLTFALSLFSVLIVVLLFFVTFRNWLRQKKLSNMKSDFINNITHEFNTPLTAIIVANKSLQNERIIGVRDNIPPLTDIIQRQSNRLKMLIGQVLDIVMSNKTVLNKEKYSLHDLLDEILFDYQLNVNDPDILIRLNKKASSDRLLLDKFHFTTMLLNILDNAIKYNNKQVKEISISTYNDQSSFFITIQDNGVGMTQHTLKHLFDKFYRDTTGTAEQTKGLGLGLYYVKNSIDAHNWDILVDSNPGLGSTISIISPF